MDGRTLFNRVNEANYIILEALIFSHGDLLNFLFNLVNQCPIM